MNLKTIISAAICALAASVAANKTFAQQAYTQNDIVRLSTEFKAAYLPGGQIPLRPTAVAMHRWEMPIKIEIDSRGAEKTPSDGVTNEIMPQLQDLLERTMGQRPEIVTEEDKANVLIVVGSSEVATAHLHGQEAVEKYFAGWDLGLGEFTSVVTQSGCAFEFSSGPDGKIQSGIIVITDMSERGFTTACIEKGMMRVIGFEGAITSRKSIFASDARSVELSTGDEDVIRFLYGKTLRAGDALSGVIHNLPKHAESVLER